MNPNVDPFPAALRRIAWSWQRLTTALMAAILVITVALGVTFVAERASSELTWGTDTAQTLQAARVKPVPHPRMPYG